LDGGQWSTAQPDPTLGKEPQYLLNRKRVGAPELVSKIQKKSLASAMIRTPDHPVQICYLVPSVLCPFSKMSALSFYTMNYLTSPQIELNQQIDCLGKASKSPCYIKAPTYFNPYRARIKQVAKIVNRSACKHISYIETQLWRRGAEVYTAQLMSKMSNISDMLVVVVLRVCLDS
jgi:hypothetical protein